MFFSRIWKTYEALLLSHPVKTKVFHSSPFFLSFFLYFPDFSFAFFLFLLPSQAATSTTLFAGGDVLSQFIEHTLSGIHSLLSIQHLLQQTLFPSPSHSLLLLSLSFLPIQDERQENEKFSTNYDPKRTMRMFFFLPHLLPPSQFLIFLPFPLPFPPLPSSLFSFRGTVGLFFGPWLHHWYNFLGTKIVPQNAQVLTKVPIVRAWTAENRVVVKQGKRERKRGREREAKKKKNIVGMGKIVGNFQNTTYLPFSLSLSFI